MMETESNILRKQVRDAYGAVATAAGLSTPINLSAADTSQSCCTPTQDVSCCTPVIETACCGPARDSSCSDSNSTVTKGFGASLYPADEQGEVPAEALVASLGCGNPTVVAELREGETVLDLGSGGGIDVLLSARRVGPTGFAYGVDMTDEMLELAERNKAAAGATNVKFLKGTIEDVPLSDGSVDAVISNCVINLSTDKQAVMLEMFRVLAPGGRVGVSDIVAEDYLSPTERAERGSYVGCIAGALSKSEYLEGLTRAGFANAEVTFTHEVASGMHGAIVRATKPEISL